MNATANAARQSSANDRTSRLRTNAAVRAAMPVTAKPARPQLRIVPKAPVAETPRAMPRALPIAGVDEATLVTRAQAGDQAAFEALVRKHHSRLIQLVRNLVGEADAPDVAQDALFKAYRALNSFRGQSAFYTWLYRIGINTAKNHLVSRNRRPAGQDLDATEAEKFGHAEQMSDFGTPEACVLADEIKVTVGTALRKLPRNLRDAITLREFEGLSYGEIAEVMNCPVGTVRSRIFRARDAIDAVVNPLL